MRPRPRVPIPDFIPAELRPLMRAPREDPAVRIDWTALRVAAEGSAARILRRAAVARGLAPYWVPARIRREYSEPDYCSITVDPNTALDLCRAVLGPAALSSTLFGGRDGLYIKPVTTLKEK